MDTLSLKEYIYNNNKIEFVLQQIGCNHIVYHNQKDYYSCSNYNGDNVSAVNVKNNEYLNVVNWTRTKEFGERSDIITLVQYNKQCSFCQAVRYMHDILELEYKPYKTNKQKAKKQHPLDIFRKALSSRRVNVSDIHVLNEKMLDEYVPMLHIDFYREGIMPWTAKKFGLAYSYRRKRVIIPMRYWLSGDLLGINARTTVDNWEEFGIKKYYFTHSYPKSLNLFGLYENYDAIQRAGYVVVVESEKSVLKRDSLGDATCVGLSGHTISQEQIAILIGLNVEIIFALDNDIQIEEVWSMCSKFYRIRNVSYLQDVDNYMKNKDAPADNCNAKYNELMDNRIKYDATIHRKYIESMSK